MPYPDTPLIAWALGALCAATMGFAIQRGGTCTVAAVDEWLRLRSARKLAALVEASVWVAGGLVILLSLGVLALPPTGYALHGLTLAGAAMLGLGAVVNRGCVFGTVARFGSGDWAYAATPVGFYLGCRIVADWATPPTPVAATRLGPTALGGLALAAAAFFIWRIAASGRGQRGHPVARLRQLLGQRLWSPHAATTVIGITFLAMLLLVGMWTYTDGLADLARNMPLQSGLGRATLGLSLLLGSVAGGWPSRPRPRPPVRAGAVLRCAVGGALMGAGSLVIPGGNDGLILVGMPLLWPYAWVAFATMCVVIAAALHLQARIAIRQENV